MIEGATERERSSMGEAAYLPTSEVDSHPGRIYDAIVIGGGVSGCASAYELAKAGH